MKEEEIIINKIAQGKISIDKGIEWFDSLSDFDKKKAISSIVIDRGSGALSLILLSIFFLPFLFYLKYDSKLIFLIYILIILFLFNLKKFLSFLITKISLKLINYNLNLFKKTILPCILISILSFSFYFTSMIFLSKNLLLEYDNLYKSILIFPLFIKPL